MFLNFLEFLHPCFSFGYATHDALDTHSTLIPEFCVQEIWAFQDFESSMDLMGIAAAKVRVRFLDRNVPDFMTLALTLTLTLNLTLTLKSLLIIQGHLLLLILNPES